MIRLRNLHAAWRVLTSYKHYQICVYEESYTEKQLVEKGFFRAVCSARDYGLISKPRYDMMLSILFDPSVIMLSKGASGVCYAAYDCQTEQDFNDLKECETE